MQTVSSGRGCWSVITVNHAMPSEERVHGVFIELLRREGVFLKILVEDHYRHARGIRPPEPAVPSTHGAGLQLLDSAIRSPSGDSVMKTQYKYSHANLGVTAVRKGRGRTTHTGSGDP